MNRSRLRDGVRDFLFGAVFERRAQDLYDRHGSHKHEETYDQSLDRLWHEKQTPRFHESFFTPSAS